VHDDGDGHQHAQTVFGAPSHAFLPPFTPA
jgi:hypothetical protein